jgi:hypothetical protein
MDTKLDLLEQIDEVTMEAELNVVLAMCDEITKVASIMEYASEETDISSFDMFQEAYDPKVDQSWFRRTNKKTGKKEKMIVSVLLSLFRAFTKFGSWVKSKFKKNDKSAAEVEKEAKAFDDIVQAPELEPIGAEYEKNDETPKASQSTEPMEDEQPKADTPEEAPESETAADASDDKSSSTEQEQKNRKQYRINRKNVESKPVQEEKPSNDDKIILKIGDHAIKTNDQVTAIHVVGKGYECSSSIDWKAIMRKMEEHTNNMETLANDIDRVIGQDAAFRKFAGTSGKKILNSIANVEKSFKSVTGASTKYESFTKLVEQVNDTRLTLSKFSDSIDKMTAVLSKLQSLVSASPEQFCENAEAERACFDFLKRCSSIPAQYSSALTFVNDAVKTEYSHITRLMDFCKKKKG